MMRFTKNLDARRAAPERIVRAGGRPADPGRRDRVRVRPAADLDRRVDVGRAARGQVSTKPPPRAYWETLSRGQILATFAEVAGNLRFAQRPRNSWG